MTDLTSLIKKINPIVNTQYAVEPRKTDWGIRETIARKWTIDDSTFPSKNVYDMNSGWCHYYNIHQFVNYLADKYPNVLEGLEQTVIEYEKIYTEIQEKVTDKKLGGKFEHGLYVPKGDPSKHPINVRWGEGGIGLLFFGPIGALIVGYIEARNTFNNWQDGRKYTKEEEKYFALEKCRRRIVEILDSTEMELDGERNAIEHYLNQHPEAIENKEEPSSLLRIAMDGITIASGAYVGYQHAQGISVPYAPLLLGGPAAVGFIWPMTWMMDRDNIHDSENILMGVLGGSFIGSFLAAYEGMLTGVGYGIGYITGTLAR